MLKVKAIHKDMSGFDSPGMRGASQEAQRKQQQMNAILKRLSEASQDSGGKAKHRAPKKKATA